MGKQTFIFLLAIVIGILITYMFQRRHERQYHLATGSQPYKPDVLDGFADSIYTTVDEVISEALIPKGI